MDADAGGADVSQQGVPLLMITAANLCDWQVRGGSTDALFADGQHQQCVEFMSLGLRLCNNTTA